MVKNSLPALHGLATATILAAFLLRSPIETATAETCVSALTKVGKNGIITTTLSKKIRLKGCKKGEIVDPSISAYGDGSAGSLNVAPSSFVRLFEDVSTDRNTQFSSINIPAGSTLAVPGGTILRATGNVNIAGTLFVYWQNLGAGGPGNVSSLPDSSRSQADLPFVSPNPGIATLPAGSGAIGLADGRREGGVGGYSNQGSINTVSSELLRGGGGGAAADPGGRGGHGGGSIMVVAGGKITVASTGVVQADGVMPVCVQCGAGGGGGGVIVLGAKTSVTLSGKLQAKGGNGSKASTLAASGGGGGGGLIILTAPSIVDTGQRVVDGGSGGSQQFAGDISAAIRIGGGGGGASAGYGGDGSAANVDGSCDAGVSGGVGKTFSIVTDPTSFF